MYVWGYKRRIEYLHYSMNKLSNEHTLTHRALNTMVIVAALGYFVDIYDLILFGVVRTPSLKTLGFTGADLMNNGIFIFNMQMYGMLIGGIIWGVLGDKKGRLSVLFATILLYSIANIANAYVHNLTQYAVLRFIAGLGLAGELGVGITLVAEIMSKEKRTYGTMIVGGVGVLGAVVANIVAKTFDWQSAYLVGGVLGLLLLALRIFVSESGMFNKLKESAVKKGNFLKLFTSRKNFFKYLYCILLGLPVWFIIGILIFYSAEFAQSVFHIQGTIDPGTAIMYHYTGASIGSLIWSMLSQYLHSRKKALWFALATLIVFTSCYFFAFGFTSIMFYLIIFFLGISQGYWTVFVTVASEQFGTNMRATVTTTVPNFVRGSVTLLTLWFKDMKSSSLGMWNAALIIGVFCILLSLFSLYKLSETFGKSLDYVEE